MLYIQFEIKESGAYLAFQKVYDLLRETKPAEKSTPMNEWLDLLPESAQTYLKAYHEYENGRHYLINESLESMINYLEFGLEVDFQDLSRTDERTGKLSFAAYSYPYGGMERLLFFLKAFQLLANEVYNGFDVNEVVWSESDEYEYEGIGQPEKTKEYLAQFK